MAILPFLLQIVALFCFLCATFGLWPNSKVSWGWAGAFLVTLSLMVSGIVLHPIAH